MFIKPNVDMTDISSHLDTRKCS